MPKAESGFPPSCCQWVQFHRQVVGVVRFVVDQGAGAVRVANQI